MRISPIDAGISRKFETQSWTEIAQNNNSGELIIKMDENKDAQTEFLVLMITLIHYHMI